MKPRYTLIFLGLLACLTSKVWAQPVVSNIRVETDAQRLKVTYDLVKAADRDSFYLQVESRTRGMLTPKTVTGAIGRHIQSGVDKVIYWDYALDGERLTDEIRPTVGVVRPYTGPPVGGGPASALASVLLPGAGTILVQPNHKIGWRPLITVAYGGLLVYGLVQKSQYDRQYRMYTEAAFRNEAEVYYESANRMHKHCIRAIQAAATVLITDVMYTAIKGAGNVRQIRKFQQQVSLNYIGNTPTIGMQLTF